MPRTPKRPAGYSEHGKSKAIAVRFSAKLFERIADEAELNGRTFSSQVRVYIGLAMTAAPRKEDAKP
ncbi:hypothetical protein [Bradyrhizobium japonicum]|uniref:hypothetical protein n=1 Tax=Bradyrhizobium japonicum TaxID=375 RepID=UPI000418D048|nr:hypothetical protein [Bradyrhizobium japonicum]